MLKLLLKKPAQLAFAGVMAVGLTTGATGEAFAAEKNHFSIGTGGQTGVYYVVGQSICKMVNRGTKKHNLRCSAPSTGGSVANINAIRDGGLEMGVAQSDWQYHAFNGTSKFDKVGAYKDLRAVFSVHPELFTLVARADSGIKTFEDLKDKRVNIGNPGSGSRGTMETLMSKYGWDHKTFKLASELKPGEHSQALCDNKIDAFVYTVGHPTANIKEAASSCDVKIIPVAGKIVDSLVAAHPYFAKNVVVGGTYAGTDEDVQTFGVAATFVSSTKVSADDMYNVVKAVFDNFDRFKRLHPAFANLKPEDMIKNGLSAPLHEGAVRYYKERGWM